MLSVLELGKLALMRKKQGNINSSEFSPILDKCIPTSLESHNSLSLSEMLEKIYLYNSRVLKDEEHDSAFKFVELYLEECVKSYFFNVYHSVVSLFKKNLCTSPNKFSSMKT